AVLYALSLHDALPIFSWTTVNPKKVKDFRNLAGLPSGGASGSTNTANFMIQGQVKSRNILQSRSALPLDGNKGGLPELIIDPKRSEEHTSELQSRENL